MKCIYCFLKDYNQSSLRKLSQVTKDRHEEILEYYRDIFLKTFKQNLRNEICEEHELLNEKNFLEEIKKIDISQVEYFFNELIKIYTKWIEGVPFESITMLQKLLESKDILSGESEIKRILYRGRWGIDRDKNEHIYNVRDMFHIPFDKRYLIANQRFSINGYPLLYLGCSIYNVFKELQCDNLENLAFSYFYYQEKNELSIYDLTNPFYKSKYINISNEQKSKNGLNDSEEIEKQRIFINEVESQEIEKDLYILILSSFCGFEKRKLYEKQKNTKFYEEYVLPQILTQVLKNNNNLGIMYPSTRIQEMKHAKVIGSSYRNNVVLFTRYSKEDTIDLELFKKFIISNPLRINQIYEKKNIDEILDEVEKEILGIEEEKIEEAILLNQIVVKEKKERKELKEMDKILKEKEKENLIETQREISEGIQSNLLYSFFKHKLIGI